MSWFWGSKKGEDPTSKLNPDLKEFLDQQQPRPYVAAELPKPPTPVPAPATAQPQGRTPPATVAPQDRPLPKESLYQDGRYKDIWKTYVSQDEMVVENKTPAERVMGAKKDRRQMIHRAALENCAFEQEMQQNCFTAGDATSRARATMTMCRQETKAFNRCYQLQAKFLQALGYLSSPNMTNEDEEKVQMHADKLYHRMMDYEVSADEARKNNQPVPPLSSVFNPNRPAPTIEEINLPPGLEKSLKKPLRDLPPHEREVAAKAILQEAKLAQVYADDFFKYTTTLNEGRQQRQNWLVDVFGDVIGKFLIPDPPSEHKMTSFKEDELDREIWKDGSIDKVSKTSDQYK